MNAYELELPKHVEINRDMRPPTLRSYHDIDPLNDYVLLQRTTLNVTAGGIALPEGAQRQDAGLVLKIGPGAHTEFGAVVPVVVSPGDFVFANVPVHGTCEEIESDDRAIKYALVKSRYLTHKLSGEALVMFQQQYAEVLNEVKAIADSKEQAIAQAA